MPAPGRRGGHTRAAGRSRRSRRATGAAGRHAGRRYRHQRSPVTGARRRRWPSALADLSSGLDRAKNGRCADRPDRPVRQVPAGVTQRKHGQVAITRGDLEAGAGQTHRAIGAPLAARHLDPECGPQFRRRIRAVATDIGAGQIARQRGGVDLGMARAVILLLDPGLGGLIEQVERQRLPRLRAWPSGALRHDPRRIPAWHFDTANTARSSDARPQTGQATDGLFGEHGGAVVGHQGTWQPRFMNACDRPCTRLSAVSSRYHCRWQTSRERSSMTPSSSGLTQWPARVSTLREHDGSRDARAH
jgi:hypothetical protein